MKTAFRGTLLASAPLIAAMPLIVDTSARVHPSVPTTDATCVLHSHGPHAATAKGGGSKLPAPDTLATTGTVTCVDPAGAPVASGAFERTTPRPASKCTGHEREAPSTTTVHWHDGTTSTVHFDKSDIDRANGTASLVASGEVTADSDHFATDTVKAVGTSTGPGCDAPAGKTALDSTLVLRLIH
ncbi:hypothetical protein ACIQF6_34775 [Kitasatospora sp. NPDC092948]|uniref:hypothetical protein n=1 Tax=Kitasatospora sp. NPDC092948 TaxID=3364088 RepID=UPI003809F873